MLLLILFLVFGAVTTATLAMLSQERAALLPSEANLPVRYEPAHAPSGAVRVLYPLLNILAPLFEAMPFPEYRRTLADNLRKAGFGESVTVNHIFALKLIMAIVTPLFLRLIIDSVNWPPIFLATMAGGFMLPDK